MILRISRRDALKTGGFLAGAALSGAWPAARLLADEKRPAKKRVLRFAHLTDAHVQPELAAAKGLAKCLHHVQEHPDKPELILFGGDAVMDSLASTHDRTRLQWDLWHDVYKQECSLPLEGCIGNHDVWGWNKAKSKAQGDEPQYGKNWAVEAMRMGNRYRSFDRAGWHFVVLDSIFPGHGDFQYIARLDEAQLDWLKSDLSSVDPKKPVLILSHIPILSAAVLVLSPLDKQHDFRKVSSNMMHVDSAELRDLFAGHANVKLCLSGHLHLVERVDSGGVSYLCGGAICGNWWKGDHKDCKNGYALVNLYDDGSFESEYVNYGWVAQA